jgi:DNA-binding NarL/FixJ family response regulator
MRTIRVLVVDDHEIVRAGLRTLLAREQDIHVVGGASNAEDALDLIRELSPEVAVVDYSLPKMSGVELCEIVVRHYPKTAVIMLTTFLDDEVIHSSLQAGAKAYVYKDAEGRDLKRTIRAVADGQAVLDPKVAGRVMRWAKKKSRIRFDTGRQALSPREIEVLRLVTQGATNPEVAETLGITRHTVNTYVQRAFSKLGVHSRSEAIAVATKRGIL